MGQLLQTMFEELSSWRNLLLAYSKAAKGKRGQAGAAAFEYRLEDNLLQIQRELRLQSYQPGGYASFLIHDPKRRLISAAPFRDRVVHHALCSAIEPLFERGFIEDSYANRVGKGTHRACDRCQQYARKFRYVLQIDVRQFFPSIDHAILLQILERKISDPGAHPRPVTEGIPFLGFVIYPERRRLKRRKGVYYQRRLSRLREAYVNGEIELGEMSASVRGWANHVRYSNSAGLRKALFGKAIEPPLLKNRFVVS